MFVNGTVVDAVLLIFLCCGSAKFVVLDVGKVGGKVSSSALNEPCPKYSTSDGWTSAIDSILALGFMSNNALMLGGEAESSMDEGESPLAEIGEFLLRDLRDSTLVCPPKIASSSSTFSSCSFPNEFGMFEIFVLSGMGCAVRYWEYERMAFSFSLRSTPCRRENSLAIEECSISNVLKLSSPAETGGQCARIDQPLL